MSQRRINSTHQAPLSTEAAFCCYIDHFVTFYKKGYRKQSFLVATRI
ncbi:hypothetical protein GJA_1053 [Janthinobacterium agaricidamnosum NBRC 102515 = DSM 9628]|uniref:Uncharacterized protein n=1 Tax=Janthinobacterium agaricidamnosum NBRC 102515 = DSM 9628 TaxID=1349767 RepID=W0V2X4_9BURK|nr:hypothetical protein GJA_1053 [Janthinobacterium agaricidamnosum NBRC 102515 = DSM 9628]